MIAALQAFAALTLVQLTAPAEAAPDTIPPLLIGGIAASEQRIAFSHAGDLWIVGHDGGTARRVTSGPAEDDYPSFSPDGSRLAFSRRTADDWNIYVVAAEGGTPRQLTYHPEADLVRGWTPDGARVLFMSHREATWDFRLYTIPVNGVFPEVLPLSHGFEGAYEPSGERLAYVPAQLPLELLGTDWAHYRGGMASGIRIASLRGDRIERLPRDGWNDRTPLWTDAGLFFVSDRSGTFNLYRHGPDGGQPLAITSHMEHGIRSAAAARSVIAFVRNGRIHLYRPGAGEPRVVPIRLPADEQAGGAMVTVDAGSAIQSVDLSSDAGRALFSARGELLLVNLADGGVRNLTETPGVAERYGSFSPDGRRIAYFTDAEDRYELRVRGLEDERIVRIPVELRSSFYREPVWSPDGRRIAFTDKRLALWVADVETGGARRVSSSEYPFQGRYHSAWSPDGRRLAYSRFGGNGLRRIHIYEVATGTSEPVTDERIHAESPTFDPDGDYLYFIGSLNSGLTAGTDEVAWAASSAELFRPLITRRLYAVVLSRGGAGPLQTAERTSPGRAAEGEPAARRRQGARASASPGRGDPTLQGSADTARSIVPLPPEPRDFESIAATGSRRLYVTSLRWPSPAAAGDAPTRVLHLLDLSDPERLPVIAEDLSEPAVARAGRVLFRSDGRWHLHSAAEGDEPARALALDSLRIETDLRAEWRQMFHESARLARLYFYDRGYHGRDLDALERDYTDYLPSIGRRRDLNILLTRMLGELSVSHLAVRGGDIEPRPAGPTRIGLLGADYAIENGHYRFARIYTTPHFSDAHPLLRAPLDRPGVDVRPGDVLLAVNGEPVTAARNLYSYFEGTASTPTEITVAESASGTDRRTYTVVPLPGENTLRRRHWAEQNRRFVEEATAGKIGYIYIPDFGGGLEAAVRDLLAYRDRSGLIIDQRFAPGGVTADFLAGWLRRDAIYYYTFRHGRDMAVPLNAIDGRAVLLTNRYNASAAETFALMFKLGGMGVVIGERTMGAGIGGATFIPELIDGGRVTIPNRAAYDPSGSWAIENRGVEPDVAVEPPDRPRTPDADPFLERAIEVLARELTRYPPDEPRRPPPPEYPRR